jgi:hypothetical protein
VYSRDALFRRSIQDARLSPVTEERDERTEEDLVVIERATEKTELGRKLWDDIEVLVTLLLFKMKLK